MQLHSNTRRSKSSKIIGFTLKLGLPIIIIFVAIFFLSKIEMPSPNKAIKQEISSDKISIIK